MRRRNGWWMDVWSHDVCHCGDYRHQHASGGGRCAICWPNDMMNGVACHTFRLSRP